MGTPAVDFSFTKPSVAQLDAAGIDTVLCYVGPAAWGKTITQPEYDAYVAAGKTVLLVFELGADDAAGGFDQGVAYATDYVVPNVPEGYPPGLPIYVSVDESVSGSALDTAVQYVLGHKSVLGARTGDYGEGALCEATEAQGVIHHWQSASTSYPGNAETLPITEIQQGLAGPIPGTDADTIEKPVTGGVDLSNFPNAVGAALTASGQGAWVVGSDGGVFCVGDAQEYGSLPGLGDTVSNIVGICRSWGGHGYFLWGSDGGVFAFGDAKEVGSYPGLPAAEREGDRTFGAGSFALSWGGAGYTLVALDGSRYVFGG